ncbi:5'-3' DNA helicase ZGRF1 isoform 2-T3 [Porphyrio hochstetteri]
MASQEFTVLYTHQKMKKSKTWQDGILRIRTGGNKVNAGDQLEGERYLITVEAVNMKSSEDQPREAETPALDRNGVKPGVPPRRHLSVGLKRKFTGFQGPRQVEKKIPTAEDGENPALLPLSKQCQGTLPSRFYTTSPLFSMICKKDAETNLSAGFHEGVCMDKDREHMSVSSLLSAPFLDTGEETEKQNPDESILKPESPLMAGHAKSSGGAAGRGAVSRNIRSTAQIIALLKSKATEGCREQTTSEVTHHFSRFQAAANAHGLYNQKSTTLPAFSGNPARRLIHNTLYLPFTKGTVSDQQEWNAEMLLNSADREVTGQRHDQKATNSNTDFQDPCNTNSCFLPESTVSGVSDSQFVPSSDDIPCSASPVTFQTNLSGYREHLVTNCLKGNSPAELHGERQPRQNAGVPSARSVDGLLTASAMAEEELSASGRDSGPDEQVMEVSFNILEAFDFNDAGNEDSCEREVTELPGGDVLSQSPDCSQGEDVTWNSALRLHSCCEGAAHTNNVIKEINASQLSSEATNNMKALDVCAAHSINDVSRIKRKYSDLLPSDTNVNEGHPKTTVFEKTESISPVSASRVISAVDKRAKEDVKQLGCVKSPGVVLEHFWGTESGDLKPGSPLLALSQKSDPSCGSLQCIAEDHQKVFGISCKEDTHTSRSSASPSGRGHSPPEEKATGETEFESAESVNAFREAHEGERIGMDCLRYTSVAENSSDLPDLVNNIALLGALTQHSTALESLQKMEENNSISYEAETSKELFEPDVRDEAIKEFTEMPYLESIQAPSCSYFDSSGLMPNCVDSLFQQTEACITPTTAAQRDPRTSDCQPKFPGSRRLCEDAISFTQDVYFQKKSNVNKESRTDLSSLALNNMYSEVPPRPMSGSTTRSDLRPTHWTSWEPGKTTSSVELTSSLDLDSTISPRNFPSGSEDSIGDIQEPLIHRILPSEPGLSELLFTQEKSSYPEECSLSRCRPRAEMRTPFVTLPDTVSVTDSQEAQQSLSSSVVDLPSKSEAFPISPFGPEDRNDETSVFGDHTEDGQKESVQPAFPDVTSKYRQSKWLKYRNSAQRDLIAQTSSDREVPDDICGESILGTLLAHTGESSALNASAPGSTPLLVAKGMLGNCSANTGSQDLLSERKLHSLHLSQTPLAEATQKVLSHLSRHAVTGDSQDVTISELSFPPVDKVKCAHLPKRQIVIPTTFQSHGHYKQTFTAALTEQLNIMLFELSQRLHNALSKVDISFYTPLKDGQSESKASSLPLCNHMHPAKLVMVKKEGQNKGRWFYTCDAPKAEQCSFFKWREDMNPTQIKSRPSAVLHDTKSIGTYLRSQKICLYEECQLLVRKAFEIQTQRCSKFKKLKSSPARFDGDSKSKLYLKLSRKEHYSFYSKDDIWVISKTLNFDPLDTFIASSAFFGPSSNNEIELLPLKGYCPSNWRSNSLVHAMLVCNASSELTALRNMEEHFNPSTLPLIPYLLKMNFHSEKATNRVSRRKFTPPAVSLKSTMLQGPASTEVAVGLAERMIQMFSLNPDQATSLLQIARVMASHEARPAEAAHTCPVAIIRGVFGAGKSYLLSVVVLFLVELFGSSEATENPRPAPWKLLIASSTNVAVDRILLGLLDLGFEDFVRVGSIRKITKAILPYSLHAGSGGDTEQLKELLALLKEDLTPAEKKYVKRSIEQHKLGANKTILQQVKVVGATCAACPFPCLNALKFPVVMLDECSQMTEPASLLPIARFQCEKLVLVGDPKQLPPTIQGSESVHDKGLEQTLFDRLCLMGHKPVLLRTQYRCHPAISAIANELFYEGKLIDGVSEEDRSPLLDWLPTLCFYSVNGVEQTERDNSFYNMAEAHFTAKLIQSLIASGIEGSAIGVITLYKAQMCKVQTLLSSMHSEAFAIKAVQVSTVDAFQGAEKEIIVLSCVRTRQMGFIDSETRMNVALTRAKRHLLIVGSLACLSKNRLWGRVIHHCKGWENGLQHASQCEQQLNDILKYYLEKWKEEEQSKKKEK